MTCHCYSSNSDRGATPNIVLDPRSLFPTTTRTVSVDACIANVVQELWEAGVWTRGSCCGHGTREASIALNDAMDAPTAVAILKNDGRVWSIFAWVDPDTPEHPELQR